MSGPLTGLRVVELAGFGAAPFAALMLADLGADVLRIDRLMPVSDVFPRQPRTDLLNRGRRSVAVDLKTPEGVDLVLQLAERAAAFIEGYRPGVTERLGLGPEEVLRRNPRIVYGRVTGWGRSGPYASMAGHDLNFVAISGVLESLSRDGAEPSIPLNALGDGAGGLLLAFGILAGLWEVDRSDRGQVVDAAMVDAAALLSTSLHSLVAQGNWDRPPGQNVLDTGSHFMNVYRCADGRWVSVATGEERFYRILLEKLGLKDPDLPDRLDPSGWPLMKRRFQDAFARRTRDEWSAEFEGTDACVAPVLSPIEAPHHPQNRARQNFVEVAGILQPAPAPRYSSTPTEPPSVPPKPGEHTCDGLVDWGIPSDRVADLLTSGVIATSK